MSKSKCKVTDMAISKKAGGRQLPNRKHPPIRCECLVRRPLDRSVSPVTAKPAWRDRLHHVMEPITVASVTANNQSWYFLGGGAPLGGPLVVTNSTVNQMPSEIIYTTLSNVVCDDCGV